MKKQVLAICVMLSVFVDVMAIQGDPVFHSGGGFLVSGNDKNEPQ